MDKITRISLWPAPGESAYILDLVHHGAHSCSPLSSLGFGRCIRRTLLYRVCLKQHLSGTCVYYSVVPRLSQNEWNISTKSFRFPSIHLPVLFLKSKLSHRDWAVSGWNKQACGLMAFLIRPSLLDWTNSTDRAKCCLVWPRICIV